MFKIEPKATDTSLTLADSSLDEKDIINEYITMV